MRTKTPLREGVCRIFLLAFLPLVEKKNPLGLMLDVLKLDFMDDFERELLEALEKDLASKAKKQQAVEWGKLGGRPKKEIRKTEKITLRFTPDEFEELHRKSEDLKFKRLTEYCTFVLNEKEIPRVEENKMLANYIHNFTKLSNFIKAGIFNEYEKEYFMKELDETIKGLKKEIKW